MKLKEAAKVVRDRYVETLEYCNMPREHWRRIRTNNAIKRLNREMARQQRMGIAPLPGRVASQGAVMLTAG